MRWLCRQFYPVKVILPTFKQEELERTIQGVKASPLPNLPRSLWALPHCWACWCQEFTVRDCTSDFMPSSRLSKSLDVLTLNRSLQPGWIIKPSTSS